MAPTPPAIRRSVRALVLEMHLTDAMIPPTAEQYQLLWSNLLDSGSWGLRLAYRHDNIGEFASPYSKGQTPAPVRALGAPSGQCCVEYVFVRPDT